MVRKYFGRARTFVTNRYVGMRGRASRAYSRVRSHRYYGSAVASAPVLAGAAAGYLVDKEYFQYQSQLALVLAVMDGIPGVSRYVPKPIRGFAKGYVIGKLVKGFKAGSVDGKVGCSGTFC